METLSPRTKDREKSVGNLFPFSARRSLGRFKRSSAAIWSDIIAFKLIGTKWRVCLIGWAIKKEENMLNIERNERLSYITQSKNKRIVISETFRTMFHRIFSWNNSFTKGDPRWPANDRPSLDTTKKGRKEKRGVFIAPRERKVGRGLVVYNSSSLIDCQSPYRLNQSANDGELFSFDRCSKFEAQSFGIDKRKIESIPK